MEIDRLREESRRKYLAKRAVQQSHIRQERLTDIKFLAEDTTLSDRTRRQIEIDQDVLALGQTITQTSLAPEYDLKPALESGSTTDEKLKSLSRAYTLQEHSNPSLQRLANWEDEKVASSAITSSSHTLFEKVAARLIKHDRLDFREIQESLPVFKYKSDLLALIEANQITLVVGDTGSGKTTQIPQYLLELPPREGKDQSIVCTQPRRVAAMSVAARVAAERHCEIGFEVGYSVRFEDRTSDSTRIRYMTDGRLLREFLIDPFLSAYTTIVIDEAHERSVSTDILLSLLKDLVLARPELRLVVASATIDADKMSRFFGNVPTMYIPGRRFNVDTFFAESPPGDYCEAAVSTVLRIHRSTAVEQPCDILVFLTGQEEIDECVQKIRATGLKDIEALPLYAALPSEKQALIFMPAAPNCRKVIFATNIAETSLTIDTVRFVVDSGYVKQVSYDPRSGCESLDVVPISVSSATQRAGRAGRVCDGVCYRLFTRAAFEREIPKATKPELLRGNFASTLLLLLSIGIETIVDFNFVDPPPVRLVEVAYEQLYAMSAISFDRKLTDLGDMMAKMPLSPFAARAVIESWRLQCQTAVITICSILEAGSPLFFIPKDNFRAAETAIKGFWAREGDHITALNVFRAWEEAGNSRQWCIENHVQYRTLVRAKEVRDQLIDICGLIGLDSEEAETVENISKAFVFGFFTNAAYLADDGLYYTVRNSVQVDIHPSSCLKGPDSPKFCVFYELTMTSKMFMRTLIRIDPYWLKEASPHLFKITSGQTIRVTC
jgi:pre-mRNA-splicing factor ATP-dependent RNA helicase DHX16